MCQHVKLILLSGRYYACANCDKRFYCEPVKD